GWDLAFRLIDAGHDLVYTPDVRVRHMVDPTVRPSSRIYYTFMRNAIWVALRNHRPAAAVASIAQDLALMGTAALRAGEPGAYARTARRGPGRARRARLPQPPHRRGLRPADGAPRAPSEPRRANRPPPPRTPDLTPPKPGPPTPGPPKPGPAKRGPAKSGPAK